MTRIVTGIKPTGSPHLGNYFGMIRPALELAAAHDAYYFVADLHALNTVSEAAELRARSVEAAATFLALGLDPARTVLYRQSDVPEVCELAFLLASVAPKGLLNRAHAYKAAVEANRGAGHHADAGVNMGLYTYPLLMAADILAVEADLVPVGGDQAQHLEVTCDIATAFNRSYGAVLTVPQAEMDAETHVVPGIDGRKMSKSYANTIPILAEPDVVEQAVMAVVTDSRPADAPKDPEADTIFGLYRLVASTSEVAAMRNRYLEGGLRYVDAKRALLEILLEKFATARDHFHNLMDDPAQVEGVLAEGAAKACDVADPVLSRARQATGADAPTMISS